MPSLIAYNGSPVNCASRLNDAILAWYHPLPFQGRKKGFVDIAKKNEASFNGSAAWGSRQPPKYPGGDSVKLNATGDYLTATLSVPAATDFTMSHWLYVTSFAGLNPGFWRQSSPNHNWMICQQSGGNYYPWIAWGGTFGTLAPTTGYSIPSGSWVYLTWEIKSATYAKFYANGVLKQSNTHTDSNSAFTLADIGYQLTTAESVLGYYGSIKFQLLARGESYAKALFDDANSGFRESLRFVPGTSNMVGSAAAATKTGASIKRIPNFGMRRAG